LGPPVLLFSVGCGDTTLKATSLASSSPADGGPESHPTDTFYVDGRFLHDPCGNQVVLRGVNELIAFSEGRDGLPEFAEIARTGANSVRFDWTVEATASELGTAIDNAIALGLLPVVEGFDPNAETKTAELESVVQYWTSADVVEIIRERQAAFLLELSADLELSVNTEDWEAVHIDSIGRLRNAGIRVPISVHASDEDPADLDRLQASGPVVMATDPLGNTWLSASIWWVDGTADRIHAEFLETATLGLPLFISEFSGYAAASCPDTPLDHRSVMAEAQAMQIGWLAWSWGALPNENCPGGYLDMTSDGTLEGLQGWGLEVATTDPNSIANTSQPYLITLNESCE
jgi:mannan endo-1,4-beta-mannosidase